MITFQLAGIFVATFPYMVKSDEETSSVSTPRNDKVDTTLTPRLPPSIDQSFDREDPLSSTPNTDTRELTAAEKDLDSWQSQLIDAEEASKKTNGKATLDLYSNARSRQRGIKEDVVNQNFE